MREIHDGPADVVDLVEDVVPEELDDVSVAGFGPPRLVVVPVWRTENESSARGRDGGEGRGRTPGAR